MVISYVKTWVNYGWIDDCSRSLNSSRILKFEKLAEPDSKILEQERSQSLKNWLRPPPHTKWLDEKNLAKKIIAKIIESLATQLAQNQSKIFPVKVIVHALTPESFVLPSVYINILQTKMQTLSIKIKSDFKFSPT